MNNRTPVRVRFAPSPTGLLHIGNLRTALFNWLFARHTNGSFLVRIEDTDQERSKPVYTEAILSSLRWLDIASDEPLMYQSQRLDQYAAVVESLIEQGKAYRCFCTDDEIAERNRECGYGDTDYAPYDGYCRHRVVTEYDLKKPHVIRFARDEKKDGYTFTDLIRGELSLQADQLDDFIIVRSDGWPTYNLVVVVDDAAMGITHVIRGEDHIANTFKQIMLYKACGYAIPAFAHLPLILGPAGNRLSKRDAATAVAEYRQEGFLPEALFNYLVRLGWSHGDQEVFSRKELIASFGLDAVGKKGAIFDIHKLLWLNGVYMRQTDSHELLERMQADVAPEIAATLAGWDQVTRIQAVGLYKGRVKTLRELSQEMVLAYTGPTSYDAASVEKWTNEHTHELLFDLSKTLEALDTFTVEPIKGVVKGLAKERGIKLVTIAQPLRIALVGKDASPGVFELLALVGKKESIRRIDAFIAFLQKKGR